MSDKKIPPDAARAELARPKANSPEPMLALRMIGALPDMGEDRTVTPEHLLRLSRAGITLQKVAESGALLMDGIEILDPKHPQQLNFEHGAALTQEQINSEKGDKAREGWFSQGGMEVHREDNDMLTHTSKTGLGDDVIKPLFVRIRGFTDPEKAAISIEDMVLKRHLHWDISRLKKAAALVSPGRDGPA
jgi:hypothetical protein